MSELKSRLLFVLGALVVFRLGAHVPVPGIDPEVLAKLFESQSDGILGMFNMFSGGALSRFTVFALGIMPYLSHLSSCIVDGSAPPDGGEKNAKRRRSRQASDNHYSVRHLVWPLFGVCISSARKAAVVIDRADVPPDCGTTWLRHDVPDVAG